LLVFRFPEVGDDVRERRFRTSRRAESRRAPVRCRDAEGRGRAAPRRVGTYVSVPVHRKHGEPIQDTTCAMASAEKVRCEKTSREKRRFRGHDDGTRIETSRVIESHFSGCGQWVHLGTQVFGIFDGASRENAFNDARRARPFRTNEMATFREKGR